MDLQTALNQKLQSEREKHPSVLGVHFVPKLLCYKTLLPSHGYDLSLHCDWGAGPGTGRTESYIDPENEDQEGGFTTNLQYPDGLKAVIFIHHKGIGKPYLDLLSLFHEMGHADDLECGVNLKQPMSLAGMMRAEVYAHHYVAKRCIELGYRVCLAIHNVMLDDFAKTCPIYAKSVEVFRSESVSYRPPLIHKRKIKDLVARGEL